MVKSYGADAVYDYADPETPEKIKAANPTLAKALDPISKDGSTGLILKSLGAAGKAKTVFRLLPPDDTPVPDDVTVDWNLVSECRRGFMIARLPLLTI